MNFLFLVVYLALTIMGIVLMKLGGRPGSMVLFSVPGVNLPVSMTSLWGYFCYGCSFLLYTVLINRFQLGYIVPLTTGIVYVFVLIASVLIFHEVVTPMRGLGSLLILLGVILMNTGR